MLSASDKKQYMDIMHEFAAIRSELEILLSPDLQSEIAQDSAAASVENNTALTNESTMMAADDNRLAELRNKLNL